MLDLIVSVPDHCLKTTTAVGVPCGGPKVSSYIAKACYFYIFWSFGTVGFNTYLRAE